MAMSLTRKQADLLAYIALYQEQNNGVSPSFLEMAKALDLRSKSGVHRLIAALEERGRIIRMHDRARAVVVLPDDPFDGIPTDMLVAELTRRGEQASDGRIAA